MDLQEPALCTGQLFLFHVTKRLKSYQVSQFHMGFLKKKLLITLIRIEMQPRNMRGEMMGKCFFCLQDCWWGWGKQPNGQVLGASAARNLGSLSQKLCLCCLPLSACMLAFFWLLLFSLDSGGKVEGSALISHKANLGHPQKKWPQGHFCYIIQARENLAGLWMVVAKWVGENCGFKIQKL